MAKIDFSYYADGTNATEIQGAIVWGGDFETQSGLLRPVSSSDNSIVVWPSSPDGVFKASIVAETRTGNNISLVFRAVDASNYWAVHGTTLYGTYTLSKFVGGVRQEVYFLEGRDTKNDVDLKIVTIHDRIRVYRNDEFLKEIKDSTFVDGSYAGVRMDNAQHGVSSVTYQTRALERHTTSTLSGKGLTATKLGALYPPHSLLSKAGATEEFWPSPFATDRIPNWPFERYPLMIYTSTDHSIETETSEVVGGIFVRVWDNTLGDMADPSAWLEWNQVSGRPEFDHISEKSEPIYSDPNFPQTETPTPVMLNGVVHLFYHNLEVTSGGYGIGVQNTSSATSTNGIDFELSVQGVVSYNPRLEQGDGHTGYLNIIPNPITKYPYQFLANSAHGGGELSRSPGQAVWGTNDLVNFERILIWGRFTGDLAPYADNSISDKTWIWMLWDVGSIKQEGNYYRMIVMLRPDIEAGGIDEYTRPVEVLVDEDFNLVSAPNHFISLGGVGEIDEYELHHFKEFPIQDSNGNRYAVYKGLSSSGNPSGGFCRIEDIDYDWEIISPQTNKQEIIKSNSSSLLGTFSTTTEVVDGRVHQNVPAGSSAQWNGGTITLSDYDVVDIVFERIGRPDLGNILTGEIGFFDNLDNPNNKASLVWRDGNDGVFNLFQEVSVGGGIEAIKTRKIIGFGNSAGLPYNDEASTAAQNYGLRIIPSEGRGYVLDGVSRINEFYLGDLDLDSPITLGYKFDNPDTENDYQIAYESISVNTYSNDLNVANNRPTATITGTDIDYAPASTVPLVCEAEDLDGDTLTYFWEQLNNGAPTVTILDPTSSSTSFVAQGEDTNILIRVTVSDGTDSTAATGTFYITEGNAAPTVTINASKTTVNAGEQFTLTASASDTDGTIASYLWEQVNNGADSVSISSTNSASTNVTAFSSSTQQTVKLRVTVTDDDGAVGSREVDIVVLATPNQPPIANAGPDQSVAAATQFTLDGTGSQDTDGTIVEWRWTQTAGDTVTLNLEDPARPTATSPSKTTAQRLTFQLVTVDDEGAVSSPSLVNIDVAAVVQNDVLNIIDKISFTFESDGMITAFPGRANRETFRLKPSDPTGLVLEDGWFDFEANDVRRVEISMLETTGVKIISSDTDSITRERSKLHVRMGDMPIKSSTKEFEPTVSVFVGDDERGVVMTAPGLSGAPKVKYYSTTARAV